MRSNRRRSRNRTFVLAGGLLAIAIAAAALLITKPWMSPQDRVAEAWRALEVAAGRGDWKEIRAHFTTPSQEFLDRLQRLATTQPSQEALSPIDKLFWDTSAPIASTSHLPESEGTSEILSTIIVDESIIRLRVRDRNATESLLVFKKEEDVWKLDLFSTFEENTLPP